MRAVFALLLLSCGHSAPEQVFVPAKPVSDACLAAWSSTADAWEEQFGLEPRCAHLDEGVTVLVLEPASTPCPDAAGCTFGDTMYLSAALRPRQAVIVATHEWIHVLARCEGGDADAEHLDVRLWAALDAKGTQGDTVEAVAVRSAPLGPCLGEI